MKKFFVFALWIFLLAKVFPQSDSVDFADSVEPSESKKEIDFREITLSVGDIFLINILFNNSARIILQEKYAEINLDTMKKNLHRDWCWDKDGFFMNQAGHPYQGALYFTAGRSNGLNFWQSFLLAASGSLMWEEFGETTTPAVNDFITTPICGTILGEAMHRVYLDSAEICPAVAWILSPIEAFNYAIRQKQTTVSGHTEELDFIFHGGNNFFRTDFADSLNVEQNNKLTVGFGFHVQYGLLAAHDTKEPFDLFTADIDSTFSSNYYNVDFGIDGFLFSKALYFENSESTLGINLMYEGKRSSETVFSNAALGVKYFSSIPIGSNTTFSFYTDLDGVFLGTRGLYRLMKEIKLHDADRLNPSRYYNFGAGALLKTGFSLEDKKFGNLYGEAEVSFLIPYIYSKLSDSEADKHFLAVAKIGYEHELANHFSLGLRDHFILKTDLFVNEDNTIQILNSAQIYGKIFFKRK